MQSDSYFLEEEDDSLNHFSSLLLQAEERPRRADEDLCFAVGHVVVEPTALQEPLDCIFVWWQVVVWPGKLGDHLISGGRTKCLHEEMCTVCQQIYDFKFRSLWEALNRIWIILYIYFTLLRTSFCPNESPISPSCTLHLFTMPICQIKMVLYTC